VGFNQEMKSLPSRKDIDSSSHNSITQQSFSLTSSYVEEDGILYQTGFGNSFESEVIPNALPRGRNNPRQVPYQLYAEQISGTAFTLPRATNRRTWLYRIQPSVVGTSQSFVPVVVNDTTSSSNQQQQQPPFPENLDTQDRMVDPNPLRWKPFPFCESGSGKSFLDGLQIMMSSGTPQTKFGIAIYFYSFDRDMIDEHMYNSDGDFLLMPQSGSLRIDTELGRMMVHPHELCVIPRGITFSVHKQHTDDPPTRGYLLENYSGQHFQLPELGPLGSNGLANARDWYHPTAWCKHFDQQQQHSTQPDQKIYTKMGSRLFVRTSSFSPYNVIAWHGTYVPFKYNLKRFCAVNSVTYDHLDPSIYTVLTCPTSTPGDALVDIVVFPHRILATDSNTLRPPWFHRNIMSEFMGLISGGYDAKQGFEPGGASLHPCMTPHGPDTVSYKAAIADPCHQPVRFEGGMAFLWETTCQLELSPYARSTCQHRDVTYATCWSELNATFNGWSLMKQAKILREDADKEISS
jgi:homogentisate 1,2-dioxygenase